LKASAKERRFDRRHKKNVVLSGKIPRDAKPTEKRFMAASAQWHSIQPLYSGHINWWVDYSHGIRLVYRKIKVDGKEMDYIDVLKDPVLSKLLCDEDWCDFLRYSY